VRRPHHGGGFFPLLGVTALLGTPILPEHDRPDAPAVVAISYQLWQQRFGGTADVIGRMLRLDGKPHTVISVMGSDYTDSRSATTGELSGVNRRYPE
jgi:putative ABC transport system permease protein